MVLPDFFPAQIRAPIAPDVLRTSPSYRANAVSREYDSATGNLLKETQHGEIQLLNLANQSWTEIESKWSDTGNDEVYSHRTYYGVGGTAFPSGWNQDIKDKLATNRTTSNSSGTQILNESLFTYDGTTGNLLVRRDRICEGTPSTYATNGFAYDAYGNVIRHTNEVGVITTTTYDAAYQTFPYQQSVNGAFTTTTIYDARSGLVTDTTEASGLKTKNIYDEFYRLKESRVSSAPNIEPDVWTVKYDYNLGGIVSGVSQNSVKLTKNNALAGDPGHETWTYTDGLGRTIQTRVEADPLPGMTAPFRVTHNVYDEQSAQKFVTLSAFETGSTFTLASGVKPSTFTEYDQIGRLSRITPAENVTFASGHVQSHNPATPDADSPMAYSALGYTEGTDEPWVRIRTDEEGKIRKYYLDGFSRTNRIVEVTSAGNYTTLFEHDKQGRLIKITDHANNVIEWAYDDLDRPVAMSDPHLGIWKWRRDFSGRIREQTDGRGNVTKSLYANASGQQDPLGRILKKEVYDSTGALTETATYEYDAGSAGFTAYPGQLTKVSDGQGWQKFGYDVRGRMTKTELFLTVNTSSYTTQQTYDDSDRVQTITYPGGTPVILNTYDTGGMLSLVQRTDGGTATYFTSKGYNELGQGRGSVLGSGTETTLDYFPTSKRLSRLRTFKGGVDLQNLTYKYTAADNVREIDDQVHASGSSSASITATVYDDLHRLKSASGPGFGTFNYNYDSIGNVTLNGEAGAGAYSYGTARPQAVKTVNGVNYTYDLCGNMTRRGGQQLDYDARNRLSKVSASGVTTATFGYSDGGQRLWKQTSAGLQVWIGGLYEVRNGLARFYIFANGKRVCEVESATGTTHYSHGDHLGSSSVLTSAAGVETRHWEYSPFGRERFGTTQPFAVSHRFTGQVLDDETGLYYYGARYYDPNLGRFIQPDTVISDLANPQALNRYAYALNNPLKYTDPTGHESYWEGVGNVYLGFYDAGTAFVGGTIHMVAHPIQTVQGIGTAVAHPIATLTAIKDATVTTWNSGTRGQGQVVGSILIAVGTAVAPGAQVGNLTKIEQAANVGSKLERVAATAERAAKATVGLETRGLRPLPGTRQIPEGIPDSWRIRPTDSKGGTWYYDPANKGNAVRVMQGSPTSPYPNSQAPYVRWQQNGQALDVNGNIVPPKTPDAHIPLQDFRFNP